ncbi:MAG TPA: glycosyltransferase family 4 protein [Puia sp.]|nr:glycosyltransferase family 4 protein [Puia sp.]
MNDRKKILLFADWYEPGYKAGGPIRSCVNFSRHMQDDYHVYVFTSDRDLGSSGSYDNIKTDEWLIAEGRVHVFYCSPGNLNWSTIRRQMKDIQPDFIYLNSMFSVKFTIFPLLINRLYRLKSRVVLSPRGMLRASAVEFKSFKKKLFLNGFRWLGFHRPVYFLAADDTEVKDVQRYFGSDSRVVMIPNFPAALPETPGLLPKKEGELSLIYIGRVHPIKNLDYLLNILKGIAASLRLTIVGSLEDKAFWESCQKIIQELPENITVRYAGEMPNHQLPAITAEHHVFVLPTKGENFGHAIFEALSLGKPVLISDQTPWRELEISKAGWDLPLNRPDLFRQAIAQAAAFRQEEYADWCGDTLNYIRKYIGQLNLKEEYLKLFS